MSTASSNNPFARVDLESKAAYYAQGRFDAFTKATYVPPEEFISAVVANGTSGRDFMDLYDQMLAERSAIRMDADCTDNEADCIHGKTMPEERAS